LPSLIYDSTIAKDPKRTPLTVSLLDLHELQKIFLSSHALGSHRSDDKVLHLADIVKRVRI
jgi:hypothetical protein